MIGGMRKNLVKIIIKKKWFWYKSKENSDKRQAFSEIKLVGEGKWRGSYLSSFTNKWVLRRYWMIESADPDEVCATILK